MLYDATRSDLSVAVIGDHGSCKSTLIGNLRRQCKCVSADELEKSTQAATAANAPLLAYACLSDKRRSDRERRMTTSSRDSLLVTTKYNIDLVDTPGHHSYRKHAISALATTDHAMLVVDASDGVFEEGMKEENGALRELLLVAFTVGTKQLIVAVTKMDKVSFVYDRFDAIRRAITAYALQLGFQSSAIQFVPVVGLQGENLKRTTTLMPWYAGPTLLEALDNVSVPDRAIDKPLRLPVQNVYNLADGSVIVTGRIQTGSVRCGKVVSLAPSGVRARVQSIETHGHSVTLASAGMVIGIKLSGVTRQQIKCGSIVSDELRDATMNAHTLRARVVFLKRLVRNPKLYHNTVMAHCHAARVLCYHCRNVSMLDRRSGAVLQEVAGRFARRRGRRGLRGVVYGGRPGGGDRGVSRISVTCTHCRKGQWLDVWRRHCARGCEASGVKIQRSIPLSRRRFVERLKLKKKNARSRPLIQGVV